MSVIREPVAVIFGLLAFACAAGAAWQAGLAWPASSERPLARIGAASALALAAVGFSLGYWEVLSGIGDLFFSFGPPFVRVLFYVAVVGLPIAVVGLMLGVLSMLHAARVPAAAIWPAILAGAAIGWLLDPYGTLGGKRMAKVRHQHLAAAAADSSQAGFANVYLSRSNDWWDRLPAFGDNDSDGNANPVAVAIALVALAVLAIGGGMVTAALVFQEGRKKAQSQLAQASAGIEQQS